MVFYLEGFDEHKTTECAQFISQGEYGEAHVIPGDGSYPGPFQVLVYRRMPIEQWDISCVSACIAMIAEDFGLHYREWGHFPSGLKIPPGWEAKRPKKK